MKYLKTAFSILVPPDEKNDLHLFIELGPYGISFVWYTPGKSAVKGLLQYNLDNNEDLAGKLSGILAQPLIQNSNVVQVHIGYNFKESILVPERYYQSSLSEEMLAILYGDTNGAIVKEEKIRNMPAYHIYRVPAVVESLMNTHFPNAGFTHTTSIELQSPVTDNRLLCIVYHNTIKLMLHKQGILQLVQQYNYSTPDDVTYHLLNCCQQHQLEPAQVPLLLCGMIDAGSALYKRLYDFFPDCSFKPMPDSVELPSAFKELPGHFFSHLTSLATCES